MSRFFRGLLIALLATAALSAHAAELKVKEGDSICLIGNALGERLQHHPALGSPAVSTVS